MIPEGQPQERITNHAFREGRDGKFTGLRPYRRSATTLLRPVRANEEIAIDQDAFSEVSEKKGGNPGSFSSTQDGLLSRRASSGVDMVSDLRWEATFSILQGLEYIREWTAES
jgi:hypothetical protein